MGRENRIENLKGKGKATQFNGQTAAEAGRKGAAVANRKKREKRAIAETINILLNLGLNDSQIDDIEALKSIKELSGRNVTVQDAIFAKQIELAMKGHVKSAEFLIAHLGEEKKNEDADKVVIVDDY